MQWRIGGWRIRCGGGVIAVLLGCVALASLGLWQLERARSKQALVDAFARRVASAPIEVDPALVRSWRNGVDREALRYRRAQVHGRAIGQRQYLLDNRTRGGIAGYEVLTPVSLGDGIAMLVNRGWVAAGPRRDRLPMVGVSAGAREYSGVLVPAAEDLPVLGDTGYTSGGWPRVVQRVELDSMAAQVGASVAPMVMLMDSGVEGGFRRDWNPSVTLTPARHRAYAVQWFALALTLLVLYLAANARRISDER